MSQVDPSIKFEPLRKCITFLIENHRYRPHDEWTTLEKQTWFTNLETHKEPNSINTEIQENLIEHDQKAIQVQKNVQWMKYKWVLICRHMESFLRDRLDIDMENLNSNHDKPDVKKDILDTDFVLLLDILNDPKKNSSIQKVESRFSVREIQLKLIQGQNNENDDDKIDDLSEAVFAFRRARSNSFSAKTDHRPIENLKKFNPPPVPSRENRRKITDFVIRKSINLQIAKDLDKILNSQNIENENESVIPEKEDTSTSISIEIVDPSTQIQKEIKIENHVNEVQTPIVTPKSKGNRLRKKLGKYYDTWEGILGKYESFTSKRKTEDLLFYAHDRDISLSLKQLKYNREKITELLYSYFIQPYILQEILEIFSSDASTFDSNLITLQKISGLPRLIAQSFDTIYEPYKDFLLKYGEVLIREPTMFLRSFYILNQANSAKQIIEDPSLFSYFSQVLTVDEALCLLMYYGGDDTYTNLVVAILDRYETKHLIVFLLQIVNALSFFPDSMSSPEKPMVAFLMRKANENSLIAQYLYWHLSVSSEHSDQVIRGKYRSFHYRLISSLKVSNSDVLNIILNQQKLVQYLSDVSAGLKKMKSSRKKKTILLRKILSNDKSIKKLPQFDWNELFSNQNSFKLPLSPQELIGIDHEQAIIFKSAKQPIKLPFIGIESMVSVIWKFGDDLRQDECVLFFIGIIDHLLKEEYCLDLNLTTYGCLATSPKSGFVEIVPNVATISQVKSDYSSIIAYFEKFNAPENMTDVLSNYTKSLAGYCVISFLLGIGDRHMENILLSRDGRIFHIDFGFILGYDPKPFAPKIRITEDMLEVFGGVDTPGFKAFTSYCMLAFKFLRNHASILITTMRMMSLSNLPHVSESSINKTLVRNMRLDLKDEEACMHFKKIFSKSLIALAPKITERIHNIAQSLRD